MTSWQEIPQPVQDDLDALVSSALDTAQGLLDRNGELFPFGVTVDPRGDVAVVHGDPGPGEQPLSQDVLDLLHDGARHERDGLRAMAFVADVRLADSNAIRVELEHREHDEALVVLAPYRLTGLLRKRARFGDLGFLGGTRRVWP